MSQAFRLICMGRNCMDTQASGWFPSLVEISMNSSAWHSFSSSWRTLSRGHPACGPLLGRAQGRWCGILLWPWAGRPATCRPLGWSRWCGTPGPAPVTAPGSSGMQSPAGTQVHVETERWVLTRPPGHAAWALVVFLPEEAHARGQTTDVTCVQQTGRDEVGDGERRPSAKFTQNLLSTVGWVAPMKLISQSWLDFENRVGSSAGTSLWGPLGQSLGS